MYVPFLVPSVGVKELGPLLAAPSGLGSWPSALCDFSGRGFACAITPPKEEGPFLSRHSASEFGAEGLVWPACQLVAKRPFLE